MNQPKVTQYLIVLWAAGRARPGKRVFTVDPNNIPGVVPDHPFYSRPETGRGVDFMPRVLVIDDQSDVRAMIGIVLRISHFDVVEAGTAAEGMKAFEGSRFDLAIVDVFLQGSNGVDLIVRMREKNPELPIVAISGIMPLDFVAESPELSSVVCLQKPFRPNDLLGAIDAARAKNATGGEAVV
jgi:DNA-binding NtrC family response regulator